MEVVLRLFSGSSSYLSFPLFDEEDERLLAGRNDGSLGWGTSGWR
jgi:hypothetical protein